MGKLRIILIALGIGVLAFMVVAVAAYATLWHFSGMDQITPGGTSGVVLGAVWCIGWSPIVGVVAGLAAVILYVVRLRHQNLKRLLN